MKKLCKRILLFLSLLLVSPLILITRLGYLINFEDFFNFCACGLSLFPGKIGSYIRVAYYIGTIEKIPPDVYIGFGSFFSRRTAEVGRNVYIGAYCILGSITVKDNVLIASRVSIPSGRHQHGNTDFIDCSGSEGMNIQTVKIGSHTWIGEGAVVMADVGEDCIIGSGSIVTQPVPNHTVAVGNPARALKKRK